LAIAAMLALPLIGTHSAAALDLPEAKKWECRNLVGNDGRVLITLWHPVATQLEGSGYIRLEDAGASFPTAFRLDGLSLRWNWDLGKDDAWEHSFVIEPEGIGKTYDFSGAEVGEKVSAKNVYRCKQVSAAVLAATVSGNPEVVRRALSRGADVNAKNGNGWTALMRAAMTGHAEIAKLLIDAGADVDANNKDGQTALMLAVKYEKADMVRLLKKAGAKE